MAFLKKLKAVSRQGNWHPNTKRGLAAVRNEEKKKGVCPSKRVIKDSGKKSLHGKSPQEMHIWREREGFGRTDRLKAARKICQEIIDGKSLNEIFSKENAKRHGVFFAARGSFFQWCMKDTEIREMYQLALQIQAHQLLQWFQEKLHAPLAATPGMRIADAKMLSAQAIAVRMLLPRLNPVDFSDGKTTTKETNEQNYSNLLKIQIRVREEDVAAKKRLTLAPHPPTERDKDRDRDPEGIPTARFVPMR